MPLAAHSIYIYTCSRVKGGIRSARGKIELLFFKRVYNTLQRIKENISELLLTALFALLTRWKSLSSFLLSLSLFFPQREQLLYDIYMHPHTHTHLLREFALSHCTVSPAAVAEFPNSTPFFYFFLLCVCVCVLSDTFPFTGYSSLGARKCRAINNCKLFNFLISVQCWCRRCVIWLYTIYVTERLLLNLVFIRVFLVII